VITLVLTATLDVPVEAESIAPDALAGRSLTEIERLPALQGNRAGRLADFFAVRGEPDDAIRLEGDFARVKYIGKGMTRGRLEVAGDAGMHLGAEMRGGEIHVRGSVGDWAGAEMRGGRIVVDGHAGHLLGAAYRGSPKGMRGGTILVRGRAGNEVGCAMRRGLIVVGGDAGDFAGVMMLAGSIFVFGSLGWRPGAGMKRGTVVTYQGGREPPRLLPTFRYDCDYRPAWIALYLRELAGQGFELPERARGGRYRRYSGDFTETGKGEILVWTSP
jgi:formylmethanofuran dehydrogenase subunit C